MRAGSTDHKFARHVSGFTFATLISRILGYARDAAIVYIFGGGRLSDAFYASFRIANFVRRTLGEGAMSSAFVPVLERKKTEGGEKASEFFSALWSGAFIVSAAAAVTGIIAARPLVGLLSYGFTSDPAQFALVVTLTRIFFPHIIFVTGSALCQGALNVSRKFFIPALAPVSFSVAVIAYIAALHFGLIALDSAKKQIMGLAAAATLGGAAQWLILIPYGKKAGYSFSFRAPWKQEGIREVLLLMGPAILSSAGDQLSVFVDTVCASFLEPGSMTAIYNSTRLMQLPLALFGAATASVALPHLSEKAGLNKMDEYRSTFGLSLRIVGFILVPATIGLAVLSLPVIRTLFEHGKFTRRQSLITHGALFYSALGLTAHGINKVSAIAFYSLKDALTPVKVTLFQVLLDAAVCVTLMGTMGAAGLTLASSISAAVSAAAFLFLLRKKTGRLDLSTTARQYLKFLLAGGIMGFICLALKLSLEKALHPAFVVAIVLPAGIISYSLLAILFGIEERFLLWTLLTGKKQDNA